MEARSKYEPLWALLYVAFAPCLVLPWGSKDGMHYTFMVWEAAGFAFLLLSFGLATIHQRFGVWFFWGSSLLLHYVAVPRRNGIASGLLQSGIPSQLALIELTIFSISVAFLIGGTRYRPMAWLLVSSAIAAVLARSGSSEFGADGMINWIAQFGISPEIAETLTIVVRKSVHMAFFGSIGATAWLALRIHGNTLVQIIWPLAWTLFHASFDEYRQSLTPNRTGTIADVAIDLIGAGVAIWILHNWAKKKSSRHESSHPPSA